MWVKGSAYRPNDWSLQGPVDPQEQAAWYQALFAACAACPWFGGTALWDWPLKGQEKTNRYAFVGMPAQEVIRTYYSRKAE